MWMHAGVGCGVDPKSKQTNTLGVDSYSQDIG